MRELLIETPEGVDLRYELAGPGSRSAATLLDLVIFTVSWIALALVLAIVSLIDPVGLSQVFLLWLIVGTVLLLVLFVTLAPALMEGQTPGKRRLGIRVTSADGYPASSWQHFLRGLFLPIELMLVGLAFMLMTPRGQRLGDLVAGTVVVREPRPTAGAEPFPNESWEGLQRRTLPLVPALAARLDADDHEFLRRLLARRDLEPEERRRLFVAAAGHYAQRLELGPFEDARVLLKELYLYLRDRRRLQAERGPG